MELKKSKGRRGKKRSVKKDLKKKKREEKERQERLEREDRQRQKRLEREKIESQHEFEMRKLELQVKLGSDPSIEKSSAKFDVTKHIKFAPPFQQADVDKNFLHFEKVARNLKWPKEYWVMLLQSVLVGKASEIYLTIIPRARVGYEMIDSQ